MAAGAPSGGVKANGGAPPERVERTRPGEASTAATTARADALREVRSALDALGSVDGLGSIDDAARLFGDEAERGDSRATTSLRVFWGVEASSEPEKSHEKGSPGAIARAHRTARAALDALDKAGAAERAELDAIARDVRLSDVGKAEAREAAAKRSADLRAVPLERLDAALAMLDDRRATIASRWASKLKAPAPEVTHHDELRTDLRVLSTLQAAGPLSDERLADLVAAASEAGDRALVAGLLRVASVSCSDPIRLRAIARAAGSRQAALARASVLDVDARREAAAELFALDRVSKSLRALRSEAEGGLAAEPGLLRARLGKVFEALA